MNELENAIGKMKLGKAAGADQIAPEMVKYLNKNGKEVLLKIMNQAWHSKKIPKDWKTAVIVPIHKKGDNRECANHRGVSLLSVPGKLYSRILENRLRSQVEKSLAEPQCGFRPNRSTQDLIFTLRQTIEKSIEYNKKLYLCFIDLEKAFDRVPWKFISASLRRLGVQESLITRIMSFYQECESFVRTANCTSTKFTITTGVRQGDVLSPLLFVIVMNEVIQNCERRCKKFSIGNWRLQPIRISALVFADDVGILGDSPANLQHNIQVWKEELERSGLTINTAKTKIMVIAREEVKLQCTLENKPLEQVNCFKYLGAFISQDGKIKEELNERIASGGRLYYSMNRKFLAKKEIGTDTKLAVYRSVCVPTICYSSETWTMTKNRSKSMQAIEMKFLRGIAGKTRRDRVRNSTIRQGLGVRPLEELVKDGQLRWFGHVNRMGPERYPKKALEARPEGRRPRGRRRTTWIDNLQNICQERNIPWDNAQKLCLDRSAWRRLCQPSTPPGGRRGFD